MEKDLLFEFTINKENDIILVKKEFAAGRVAVWEAWTKPELLDQWWAPKPWKAETKTMDFREGGFWLYAMMSPHGERHWAKNDYRKVTPYKNFTAVDAFCDEQGNVTRESPKTLWQINFTEEGDRTLVTVEIEFEKPSDLEKLNEMGFREGFTKGLENLDELLLTYSK